MNAIPEKFKKYFKFLKLTDFYNDIYNSLINDNTHYNLWFEFASSSRNATPCNDRNGVCMSLRGCPQTAAATSTAESVSLSKFVFLLNCFFF
ncbi:MAG: hypothetical protein BWY69_00696 [Planctomycetes bacterium ADurb.Bin401]|nr:MAG: hypothetical protein BWY69_00696 [Planctomycetes bacterium ADurb.Bin401]